MSSEERAHRREILMKEAKYININSILIIIVSIVGIVFSLVTYMLKTPAIADEMIAEIESDDTEGLFIPLPENVDSKDVVINNDFSSISVVIPGGEDKFYYENTLRGNGSLVSQLRYGYIDDHHIFDISFNELSECEVEFIEGGIAAQIEPLHKKYETIIVINPLHGGEDSGNIAYSISENYVNHSAALALQKHLKSDSVGVYILRDEDENPSESERVEFARNIGADLMVSIYCNADASTRVTSGMEFSADSSCGGFFEKQFLDRALDIKKVEFEDADEDFAQLNISMGYLTNKMDAKAMVNDNNLDEIMANLAEIISQLNVK